MASFDCICKLLLDLLNYNFCLGFYGKVVLPIAISWNFDNRHNNRILSFNNLLALLMYVIHVLLGPLDDGYSMHTMAIIRTLHLRGEILANEVIRGKKAQD
jgi:hypothetical protein